MRRRGSRAGTVRTKVFAMLSGGLVLGVGTAVTLATWADSEWIHAGDGSGGPGVGTSSFEVQQDANLTGVFSDFDANPGDELVFGPGALSLSPGQTVYAPVALRTTAASVGGTLTLQGAVAAAGVVGDLIGTGLWTALTLQVTVDTTTYDCDASAMTKSQVIPAGSSLTTASAVTQPLAAAGGSTQYYCFAITLPLPATPGAFEGLKGRTIAPAWEFLATSE